jgi:hypothetical protein
MFVPGELSWTHLSDKTSVRLPWRSAVGCVADTSDGPHRLHYASAFRFITFVKKGASAGTAAEAATLLPANGTLAVLLILALTPGQPTLRLQVTLQRTPYLFLTFPDFSELTRTLASLTAPHFPRAEFVTVDLVMVCGLQAKV